jgi:hypothetical protein
MTPGATFGHGPPASIRSERMTGTLERVARRRRGVRRATFSLAYFFLGFAGESYFLRTCFSQLVRRFLGFFRQVRNALAIFWARVIGFTVVPVVDGVFTSGVGLRLVRSG